MHSPHSCHDLLNERTGKLCFSRDWTKTIFMSFSIFSCLLTSTLSFTVTSFFMGSLCGVCKCFNIKYLRLEIIDSISFGLLANALIYLLHVHLVLCKFFNALFFCYANVVFRNIHSDCTWPARSDSLEDLCQYCSVRFCTNIFSLEFTICLLAKVRHWLSLTSLLMEKCCISSFT